MVKSETRLRATIRAQLLQAAYLAAKEHASNGERLDKSCVDDSRANHEPLISKTYKIVAFLTLLCAVDSCVRFLLISGRAGHHPDVMARL